MRANVMNDAALTKLAGQVAWLSINSDRPENAAFVKQFPINGWPSYLVIDPASERIALNWYGTATASQLAAMIEDGARWIAGGGSTSVDRALARADAAAGRKQYTEAASAYREALQAAPANWARRPRVLESEIMALSFAKEPTRCATTAAREAPGMARDRSFANVLYFGIECALELEGKPEWKTAQTLIPLAEESVKQEDIFSDDRSGLYSLLAEYRKVTHDEAGRKKVAGEWLAFLEDEVKREPAPEGRASCISNMGGPVAILGVYERRIPYLQAWERDLPKDYNAPLQLGRTYYSMKRYDLALAAADRALARSYGGPKLGVYDFKAGVQKAKGDPAGARRTLAEGLAFAAKLPQIDTVVARTKTLQSSLAALGPAKE